MPEHDEDSTTQASSQQIAALRELGIDSDELEDLSYADAEAWIASLTAEREDAGHFE